MYLVPPKVRQTAVVSCAMASSAALLAGTVAISLLLLYLSRRPRYRLPPGPKGLPGVGNLYNAPKVFEWLVYQDWARQYGADFVLH